MIVFKYGGHAISEELKVDPILAYLADLIKSGENIVIVHGGGPQINRELEIHGVKSEMVKGLRKTSTQVYEVVARTLSGEVLRNLTNQLVGLGINAVGISAGDGNLIRAKVADSSLGLVGDVESIDVSVIQNFIDQGLTPVISPISVTREGVGLNMNADLVAGAIGGALGAELVMFSTDVSGIYRNWPEESSLIGEISLSELQSIAEGFEGGMSPKVNAAITAITSGAKSVRIFDGTSVENLRAAHSGKSGTLVVS